MSSNLAAGDLRDLVRLLRRRRTDLPTVEAKAAAGGLPRSVRETLSAFSNDRGGTLLLGLAEDKVHASFRLRCIKDPGQPRVAVQ